MEFKSSVDKFYDQEDLANWAKVTGAKAGDMILCLVQLIKQERNFQL
jgi:hypothetical protein